ncbi:MAG: hypothetical protein IJR55_00920, partial [Clostridia bacterium]|nr:hypothetical protein [Clostridia bacterium]
KNNASENSQLTEAQVKVIIENAISEAKLGGVTEAQVRTIVNTAVGSINTVSKADIQRIVDAATSKGLTAEQVAKVINDAGLATSTQLENVSAKVQSAVDAINALKPVTKKDVSDAIIDLVPVTYTINTAEDLADALARVKSFSTLNFTSEYTVPEDGVEITLPENDDRVLIIKGIELSKLTVNAPKATVYLATDAGNVLVTATAENSFHVVKTVETLTVNKGRVVVEENAVVTTLKAAPSVEATVKVVIEEEGTVKNLNAEYQKNGDTTRDYIEVVNNGTVVASQLTLTSTPTGEEVTTNVKVTNGANAKGTEPTEVTVSENLPASAELSVKEEGQSDEDASRIYYVKDKSTLTAALEAVVDGDTIVLLANIDAEDRITIEKSITVDGGTNKYAISASKENIEEGRTINVFDANLTVTFKNLKIVGPTKTGNRGLNIGSNPNITVNVENCDITCAPYYAINIVKNTDYLTLNITNSYVSGWAAINHHGNSGTITVENSTLVGINNYSGNTNDFSTIVIDGNSLFNPGSTVENNSVIIKNCTIVAKENTANVQSWISFQYGANYNNAIVSIDGNTRILSDSENGSDKTAAFYMTGFGNTIVMTLTESQKAAIRANDFKVVDNGNGTCTVSNTPNVYYYWAVSGGYKGEDSTFSKPFTAKWLCDGEFIDLTDNVTLSKSVVVPFNSGSFTLNFKGFTVSGAGKVVVPAGVSVIADAKADGLFVNQNGDTIVGTKTGETYTYTAVMPE